MLQVDPDPVTRTELFEAPELSPMKAELSATFPTLEMVRELPEPAYPTKREDELLQVDPDPVTKTEFDDAELEYPM